MIHHCHARACTVPVKPELLMCKVHWFMVPKNIRNKVWEHYRPGQCDDKRPSKEWLDAADQAIRAVAIKEKLLSICPFCETDLVQGAKCTNADCSSNSLIL